MTIGELIVTALVALVLGVLSTVVSGGADEHDR
jgi:hypothetical protein